VTIRNVFAYVTILTVFSLTISLMLDVGRKLELPAATRTAPTVDQVQTTNMTKALSANLRGPLGILLTQIILIVVVARMLGACATRLGQPQVIGEMIAGVLLGPSFLGMISPAAVKFLFPESSMGALWLFSQVGVMLFMFIVGTDVDIQQIFKQGHTAVLVSHASIVVPFLLGTSLSVFIYRMMAPQSVPFTAFALFLGVAMSITAFPVLARIVAERGLTHSQLGIMSLGCAAVDDVTAWCILAAVLAIVKADGLRVSLYTVLLVVIYGSVMVVLLKPILRKFLPVNTAYRESAAGVILAFALAAGLTTEVLGVHALFGAFLAGMILPSRDLRVFCKQRFEGLASGLLLPLFFAFTGLRTRIDLLNNRTAWVICIGVIVVAVAGKAGASTLAARWSGMKWNDSFALGALMNTRGLMELIVLNIGYDLGILSSQMFAILVLMAISTTLMTAPLLSLIQRFETHETLKAGVAVEH
jgi:Kef-type K+ transport system membrane component KefB